MILQNTLTHLSAFLQLWYTCICFFPLPPPPFPLPIRDNKKTFLLPLFKLWLLPYIQHTLVTCNHKVGRPPEYKNFLYLHFKHYLFLVQGEYSDQIPSSPKENRQAMFICQKEWCFDFSSRVNSTILYILQYNIGLSRSLLVSIFLNSALFARIRLTL